MTASFSLASLAELLSDLFEQVREGVILCDAAGDVLAANRSAGHQLGRTSFATTGLDELFAGPYLARARLYVQQSPGRTIDFLCSGRDGDHLFDCRLGWYGGSTVAPPLYLLTFSEALNAEYPLLSDGRRCDSIVKLRGPLANLKAAAENLLAYPDMSPVMRSGFENVIAQESVGLTRTFDDLADLCREIPVGRSNLAPSNGASLVGRMLALAGSPPELSRLVKSDAQNVLVDERWLQQLLLSLYDFLVENKINLTEIHFHPEATGRFLYLDLLWEGQPLNAADIEEWRRRPLSEVAGSPSGADILRNHGSDLWSQRAEKSGLALVRLPLSLVPAGSGDG
jgi:DNA polymerase-3 subunit epsilon